MASKHIKKYSVSFVIRRMKIKTTTRYHYTPSRMAKIRLTIPNVDEDVEHLELSYSAVGSINLWQCYFIKLNIYKYTQ